MKAVSDDELKNSKIALPVSQRGAKGPPPIFGATKTSAFLFSTNAQSRFASVLDSVLGPPRLARHIINFKYVKFFTSLKHLLMGTRNRVFWDKSVPVINMI